MTAISFLWRLMFGVFPRLCWGSMRQDLVSHLAPQSLVRDRFSATYGVVGVRNDDIHVIPDVVFRGAHVRACLAELWNRLFDRRACFRMDFPKPCHWSRTAWCRVKTLDFVFFCIKHDNMTYLIFLD